jgi:hypothetical protein
MSESPKVRVDSSGDTGTRTTFSNISEEERRKLNAPPSKIKTVPIKIKNIAVEAAKATPGALKSGATLGAKAIATAAAEGTKGYREDRQRADSVRRINAEIAQDAYLKGLQTGVAKRAYARGQQRGLGSRTNGRQSIEQQAYEYGLKKGIAKRAAQKGYERGLGVQQRPSPSGEFGLGGGLSGYTLGGDLGIIGMGPSSTVRQVPGKGGKPQLVRVAEEPARIGGGEAEVLSWMNQPAPPASKVVIKKGKPVTIKAAPRRGDSMEDILGFGALDSMRIE